MLDFGPGWRPFVKWAMIAVFAAFVAGAIGGSLWAYLYKVLPSGWTS